MTAADIVVLIGSIFATIVVGYGVLGIFENNRGELYRILLSVLELFCATAIISAAAYFIIRVGEEPIKVTFIIISSTALMYQVMEFSDRLKELSLTLAKDEDEDEDELELDLELYDPEEIVPIRKENEGW